MEACQSMVRRQRLPSFVFNLFMLLLCYLQQAQDAATAEIWLSKECSKEDVEEVRSSILWPDRMHMIVTYSEYIFCLFNGTWDSQWNIALCNNREIVVFVMAGWMYESFVRDELLVTVSDTVHAHFPLHHERYGELPQQQQQVASGIELCC